MLASVDGIKSSKQERWWHRERIESGKKESLPRLALVRLAKELPRQNEEQGSETEKNAASGP